MQPGEQVICEIKRHPIGIIGIYIATGVLLVFLAVIAFVVIPHSSSSNRAAMLVLAMLVFLVAAVLGLIFTFISSNIYWGNRWVLTSDSVTQISQTGLFDKQSSQLSLANLEDVTASQDGILAHLFNYGVIKVETAGERSKFMFPFCPNPNFYAQQILNAREQFEQLRRREGGGSYNPPGTSGDTPGTNVDTENP